ncbi:MAG: sigma-70 family RNA polymerase sigma factor [Planctomycetes bacterium]|nr:sigma-70 family RNA polymerase sigma factor [Planctomycetota bacterium]
MTASRQDESSVRPGAGQFATTRWTIVLTAGRSDTPQAQAALGKLCQTYWYPLYAYVRRQGHSREDAQDLTQEFFAKLIAKHYLGDVDRSKGKFRSFLLASLKHFLANEWDKSRAQKRGGGHTLVALDTQTAENRYRLEPVDTMTADRIYERRWALTLLDEVLKRLREEYAADGKAKLFDQLKVTLTGERSAIPYAQVGTQLGMSEGAVKVAAHRLRQRYREALRAEIAETVASPGEVEGELRHLFAVLSG